MSAEKDDEDADQVALAKKQSEDFKEAEEEEKDAITGDLFEEKIEEDIFDTLPAMDDVGALDALDTD